MPTRLLGDLPPALVQLDAALAYPLSAATTAPPEAA